MENISEKLQNQKKFLWSSYEKLEKELAQGTPESSLSVIQLMRDNLKMLEMTIKLDIVQNEVKSIESDFKRIDEYVKLKRLLDNNENPNLPPF